MGEGGLGWDELIGKRRVVILAEAGSGKFHGNGGEGQPRFAFYASLEDVGCEGLEDVLRCRLARRHANDGHVVDWMEKVSDEQFRK